MKKNGFSWSSKLYLDLTIVINKMNPSTYIDKQQNDIENYQIFNANTELIPEAPNRQPIPLIAEVSGSIANAVVQVAVPSIACIVLCRTPPVTAAANVVVISIVGAVPARKTSKQRYIRSFGIWNKEMDNYLNVHEAMNLKN